MKSIIINSSTKIEFIENILDEAFENNEKVYFILDDEILIHKFIEKLDIRDTYLYDFKLAKEQLFDFDVELKCCDKIVKVNRLSEIILKIDESKLKDYSLILDIQDNKSNKEYEVLSNLIQQFIYLDIDIDVMLAKETKERKVYKSFYDNLSDIEKILLEIKTKVENYKSDLDVINNEKENTLKTLQDITNEIETAKDRNLVISVMATRNAGKSVIVNSFLKEEYAPTSLELSTPNSCVYKAHSKKTISLKKNLTEEEIKHLYNSDYKFDDNDFESFNTPKEIKSKLHEYFIEARDKEKQAIPDMLIKYPKNKNSNQNYIIIDTPGPNLAGSSHKEIAYKWIENSDVVIFALTYSGALDSDVEKFLKDVKNVFEKYDKFYSLIIVVNKLDEIYTNNESKSTIRFLDYLRYRLEKLDYKGFYIFGTSALKYFYSLKVPQINSSNKLNTNSSEEFEANLKDILVNKRKYKLSGEDRTILSFIRDSKNKLEEFHDINNVTLQTIKDSSGMEKVINFTNYIASQKANIEIFRYIVFNIDQKFAKLSNQFLIEELQKLESKKNEVSTKIQKLYEFFKVKETEITSEKMFDEIKESMFREIDDFKDDIIEDIEEQINKEFKKLSNKKNDIDFLKSLKDGKEYLNFDLSPVIRTFDTIFPKLQTKMNKKINKYELKLKDINYEIISEIENFNKDLNKSYELDIIIALPKLEPFFNRSNFNLKFDNLVSQMEQFNNNLKKSIQKERGVWGGVGYVVTKTAFHLLTNKIFQNDALRRESPTMFDDTIKSAEKISISIDLVMRTGDYEIDNLEELLNHEEEFYSSLNDNIENIISNIKKSYERHLSEIKNSILEQVNKLIGEYKNIVSNLKNDLNLSKNDIEAKIKFVNETDILFKELNSIWSKVNNGEVKNK